MQDKEIRFLVVSGDAVKVTTPQADKGPLSKLLRSKGYSIRIDGPDTYMILTFQNGKAHYHIHIHF